MGGIIVTPVVGTIAFNVLRGKKSQNTTKLKDIKSDKGIASLPDDTKFSGKIEDKAKNGDDIVLDNPDRILQKSKGNGSIKFKKTYEAINGEKS